MRLPRLTEILGTLQMKQNIYRIHTRGQSIMSNYRFIQLDVFTNEPFAGNALAVFPEAGGLTDEQMMKIAREMNLSETVFVLEARQTADSKQQTAGTERDISQCSNCPKSCAVCASSRRRARFLLRVIRSSAPGICWLAKALCRRRKMEMVGRAFITKSVSASCRSTSNLQQARPFRW